MEDLICRRAREEDRTVIAGLVAHTLAGSFAGFAGREEKLAALLAEGLRVETFFVAETDGAVIGTAACTDGRQRPLRLDGELCRRHLGLLRGSLHLSELEEEFLSQPPYEEAAGLVEFICVVETRRGQGVGRALLHTVMRDTAYLNYLVCVPDDNPDAASFFQKLGFWETSRAPVLHGGRSRYHARIYLDRRMR